MAFEITSVYNLNNENKLTSSMIIDRFCELMMRQIQSANKDGYHKTCFYVCGFWANPKTGEIPEHPTIEQTHNENFKLYYWSDYESEIKARFQRAGYIIKPTGYIGGVLQRSEHIHW